MIIREYQEKLAKQAQGLLCLFKLAYLCMEVRTGKTLTALHAAMLFGAKKVLFVTKLKAIGSIVSDWKAAGRPTDLYVINYEQLHKCEHGWDLIILDECHCLSQYPMPAKRTKYLKKICADKPIIYLSGTPTPESYAQFFHQLWVSSYSPWKEYQTFYKWHKDFGIPKTKYLYNRQIADYSGVKADMILPFITPLMITYTQAEAGFESFVQEEILTIPMSKSIEWAVKKLRRDKIFTTRGGAVILGDTAVKEMNKIHQICSGTVKSEEGEGIVFDYSKAQFIKNRFAGKKIAIFYKYVAEMAQLRVVFNPKVYTEPGEFNAAGPDAVFISQFQSGREGTDLSTADCIIMYNIDFSAVSYWQARARLQTKTRYKDAFVYWIFTQGGIEEKIYNVVQGKKDFTLNHYRKWKN